MPPPGRRCEPRAEPPFDVALPRSLRGLSSDMAQKQGVDRPGKTRLDPSGCNSALHRRGPGVLSIRWVRIVEGL